MIHFLSKSIVSHYKHRGSITGVLFLIYIGKIKLNRILHNLISKKRLLEINYLIS